MHAKIGWALTVPAAFLATGAGCGTDSGGLSERRDGPDPMTEPGMAAPDPGATGTVPSDPDEAPPQPTAPSTAPDPAVSFNWPEAEASSIACEGGAYVGAFQCDMAFLPGLPPSVFTGPLTFTLTRSQSGEFLVVENARFDAETMGTPFGADLAGELECRTGAFEATLDNGIWGTPPFTGTFFGRLSGSLDPRTGTLSGTWELTSGTPTAPQTQPCIGTWSTSLQP